MFLKLSREDFSWSRSKKALPVFLLFGVGGCCLALLYLFSVRSHLQTIERDQTEKLLDSYLAANRSVNHLLGRSPAAARQLAAGTGFYPDNAG